MRGRERKREIGKNKEWVRGEGTKSIFGGCISRDGERDKQGDSHMPTCCFLNIKMEVRKMG